MTEAIPYRASTTTGATEGSDFARQIAADVRAAMPVHRSIALWTRGGRANHFVASCRGCGALGPESTDKASVERIAANHEAEAS